jgi:ribose/xylose/arabinose/galactoside ABC-type transport system permease subunit
MTGGRGSFVGAMLGAVFLSVLDNVTPLLNIPNAATQILHGAVLLIAVAPTPAHTASAPAEDSADILAERTLASSRSE